MPNYKRYYLENHYVFITVVTYNRNHILIKNIDSLSHFIKLHMIIKPSNPSELSKIIGSIKRRFTKSLNNDFLGNEISTSRIKRNEKGVW
jgi:REP element-mobilizing transposase RayT